MTASQPALELPSQLAFLLCPTIPESIAAAVNHHSSPFLELMKYESRFSRMCQSLMKATPQTSQPDSIRQSMMNAQSQTDRQPVRMAFCPPWMCGEDEELAS